MRGGFLFRPYLLALNTSTGSVVVGDVVTFSVRRSCALRLTRASSSSLGTRRVPALSARGGALPAGPAGRERRRKVWKRPWGEGRSRVFWARRFWSQALWSYPKAMHVEFEEMYDAKEGDRRRSTGVYLLVLLLDGRSASYIQEILHAGMGIAKSHICRAYQKRGIHKCQGIINMAKEGMRPR